MSAPYYEDATVTVHAGDCLDVLRSLPDASVDSVVTDPPYGLEFMGKEWDSFSVSKAKIRKPSARDAERGLEANDTANSLFKRNQPDAYVAGIPFQAWCYEWLRECLRVLKPGGHLLAFGGTRTWHRLACAVEDAGFEIRDSIAWMYGSGFPKSLNVAKAIASGTGRPEDIRRLSMGDDYTPSERGRVNYDHGGGSVMNGTTVDVDLTPDAERWQGWGTALKPAHEPIVVARKPLGTPGVNVLAAVELGLRNKGIEDIRWTTRPASDAAKLDPSTSSSTTPARPMGETSAAPVDASETTKSRPQTASDSVTSTPHGATPTASTSAPTTAARPQSSATKSSTPTAEPAPAAASEPESSSPSTTSTAAAPLTAKRRGARSTTRSSGSDSLTATESFAGIATGLTGSWATVRIERLANGSFVWPDGLPRTTAGGSTVAANVLAHGTGALNVDGCRVDSGSDYHGLKVTQGGKAGGGFDIGSSDGTRHTTFAPGAGRWPANVILDESQAEALDEQSGESATGKARGVDYGKHEDTGRNSVYGSGLSPSTPNQPPKGDAGGASRYFKVVPLDQMTERFRYVAKADASERVRVDGIAHPTVKPLALMRWLVRLVTPPGGTVLEPFAGSGTTVEACILEGFRCVAIERDETYLPLIRQRIHRRRDPVEAVRGTGEDAGLFDLLDGGAA